MSIDIFFEEEKIGKLQSYTEGLYTVFTAELPLRPGLFRLWLIGEGTYPLGILEPKGDKLCLSRRLPLRQCPNFTHAQVLPHTEIRPPCDAKLVPLAAVKGAVSEADRGIAKSPSLKSPLPPWQPYPDRPKQATIHFIYINGKKYTAFRY